jgi:uncharacterized membrane protein
MTKSNLMLFGCVLVGLVVSLLFGLLGSSVFKHTLTDPNKTDWASKIMSFEERHGVLLSVLSLLFVTRQLWKEARPFRETAIWLFFLGLIAGGLIAGLIARTIWHDPARSVLDARAYARSTLGTRQLSPECR